MCREDLTTLEMGLRNLQGKVKDLPIRITRLELRLERLETQDWLAVHTTLSIINKRLAALEAVSLKATHNTLSSINDSLVSLGEAVAVLETKQQHFESWTGEVSKRLTAVECELDREI